MRFSIALLFAAVAVAQDTSLSRVKRAFKAANLTTDLTIEFNPQVLLEVTLPGLQINGTSTPIHAGQTVPRNATAIPGTFSVAGNATSGPFVVIEIDPDAPTPQNTSFAQVRHFMGGNFYSRKTSGPSNGPSKLGAHKLTNKTAAVTEWLQPSPPAGSDPHRYTFLLFKQPVGWNNQTEITANTTIGFFNVSQFAASTGLGEPIGGTFMLVGPDATSLPL